MRICRPRRGGARPAEDVSQEVELIGDRPLLPMALVDVEVIDGVLTQVCQVPGPSDGPSRRPGRSDAVICACLDEDRARQASGIGSGPVERELKSSSRPNLV